ncbi:MAG TPA: DUF4382 domain-containing protein [Gammaproteobacteria bacterium]|nr:DUF4382 domain-containing protein [Gammaproteobacteria bacterium]
MKHFFQQHRNALAKLRRRFFLGLLLAFSGLLLTACGGSSDNPTEGDGEVVIGLTDAEGDFASYTVDVKSLTLTKANGAVVETLPVATRVDFAQYTELTEFLTAATVPNGVYVKASMVLDYANADIWVEDANGDAVQVTSVVDSDGNAINELAVSVRLEGRNALLIAPGIPAHLTLDFDLEATNAVDFTDPTSPTVTVEPMLLAELDVEKFKTHRLRGPLADVDVANNRFEVILRPFHHPLRDNDRRRHFGTLDVVVNDTTVYDIDGVGYEGQAGLQALDTLPTFAATVVVGEVKFNPRRFEASEVYAGSSVPGGTQDVVTGNVIARNGDVLTVKGATLIRAGGSVVFNDEVTVNLGGMTTVKRQLDLAGSYGIGDISVGQRVRIFGTLTDPMAPQLEMDAGVNNEGRVQMRFTTLRGTVVGMATIQIVPPPQVPLVMNLQAIDGRKVALFDFAGTGIDAANDADPLLYEIDTGSLDVSRLADGKPIKVRGFVRPFGSAPADFTAQTVVDVSALRGVLAANWEPASNTAISVDTTGLALSLDCAADFHYLVRGRVVTDLCATGTGLDGTARIEPFADGEGVYLIAVADVLVLHTTFADFSADLANRLGGGAAVRHLGARGSFDDANATLQSRLVEVSLQ